MKTTSSPSIVRLSIIALTVLAFAGCTAAPAPTPGHGGAAAHGDAKEVILDKVAFSPKELTVTAGTTVTWVNKEEMPHDVTGKDKAWGSPGGMGAMKKGMSFSKTFDEPGTHDYYCAMHSSGPGTGMWGKITVT